MATAVRDLWSLWDYRVSRVRTRTPARRLAFVVALLVELALYVYLTSAFGGPVAIGLAVVSWVVFVAAIRRLETTDYLDDARARGDERIT